MLYLVHVPGEAAGKRPPDAREEMPTNSTRHSQPFTNRNGSAWASNRFSLTCVPFARLHRQALHRALAVPRLPCLARWHRHIREHCRGNPGAEENQAGTVQTALDMSPSMAMPHVQGMCLGMCLPAQLLAAACSTHPSRRPPRVPRGTSAPWPSGCRRSSRWTRRKSSCEKWGERAQCKREKGGQINNGDRPE